MTGNGGGVHGGAMIVEAEVKLACFGGDPGPMSLLTQILECQPNHLI